jgi:AcrR family transcriptional regulator
VGILNTLHAPDLQEKERHVTDTTTDPTTVDSIATDDASMVPVGRRERKRLETRQALVDAAINLFAEQGFDRVTVTDIADRADVDASTFFRHFGSKEAVLFTDMVDFTDSIGPALGRRPADEPLFDAIVGALVELGGRRPFDVQMEFLRARLTQSSAALQAQSLVYRERLVSQLAEAIAARIGADPVLDAGPYLAATVWGATLDFYRRRAVATAKPGRATDRRLEELLPEVLDMLRPIWPTTPPWS